MLILILASILVLSISILGISENDVYAQCIDEPCIPPKEITEKLYENEEPYKIRQLQLFNYDDRRNQIERTHLDKNNKITHWEKKVYDDRNNLSEIKQYYPYKENISHEKFNYIFHNNLIVKISTNSNDIITGKVIYLTNDEGKIIKYQHTTSRGNPILTYIYNDNPNGQEIEYKEFLGEKLVIWNKKEYDKKGNMISSTLLYPDERIERMLTFEYENDKKISEKIFTSSSYLKSEKKFEYDHNENLVKVKTFDRQDNLKKLKLSIYDENNNEIERKIIEYKRNMLMGYITKWQKMNYDDDGNVTDQKMLMNNGNLKDWKRYNYGDNGKISQIITFDIPKPYLQK